jgi:ATP-binding cassette subfamily B protein
VSATQTFDRVLVVEAGRIVEQGAPEGLAACPDSRYRAMLEAEVTVREGLWSSGAWRRLWLADGRVVETYRNEDTSCVT